MQKNSKIVEAGNTQKQRGALIYNFLWRWPLFTKKKVIKKKQKQRFSQKIL